MLRRRKAMAALAVLAVIALAWCLWPRNVYRYQGKTVEQWFRQSEGDTRMYTEAALEAFAKMGTNAVPFLMSRINRYLNPTLFDRMRSRLPQRLQPKSREKEAEAAMGLLSVASPSGMAAIPWKAWNEYRLKEFRESQRRRRPAPTQ